MSETETFGPRLRAERQRRGISIDTLAVVTKVGGELWVGLERNDFSRWPSGIFARAFIRDYARAIGLDGDEVVDEFCRLFPVGDRRGSRLIQAQAELIGHHPLAYNDTVPSAGDRRAPPPRTTVDERRARRVRILSRGLATFFDATCTLGFAGLLSALTQLPFWSITGVVTVMYYAVMTIALGSSPGARVVDVLRLRLPALSEIADPHRAHA